MYTAMLWTITTPSTVCVVLKTTENRWIILEISLCMSPKCCDVSPPEAKSRLTVTDQIWTVILWKSRDTSNFLLLYLVDQIILEARSTLEVSPSSLWNLTIFSYALDWEKFRGPRESERPAGRVWMKWWHDVHNLKWIWIYMNNQIYVIIVDA